MHTAQEEEARLLAFAAFVRRITFSSCQALARTAPMISQLYLNQLSHLLSSAALLGIS